MDDSRLSRTPTAYAAILRDTEALGFGMVSVPKVGALLACLAASKPGGHLLELGTGTGHGSAWLLAGMDVAARLDTVDADVNVVAVAQRHLAADPRVTFHLMDGAAYLGQQPARSFDLIYADTWPGKFTDLDRALDLLRPGGVYVVYDLLPQTNWPEGHAPKVAALLDTLERLDEFVPVRFAWASGLMLVVRRGRG